MPTFVRFVSSDKFKIMQVSLSPDVLEAVLQKVPEPVISEAVEILLDYLFKYDDLWYEDALSLHVAAGEAFFAIKRAFQVEKLVAYSIPEVSLEGEHLINMLKKRGYWLWY